MFPSFSKIFEDSVIYCEDHSDIAASFYCKLENKFLCNKCVTSHFNNAQDNISEV